MSSIKSGVNKIEKKECFFGKDQSLIYIERKGVEILESVEKVAKTQLEPKEATDIIESIVRCSNTQTLDSENIKLPEKTAEEGSHQTMTVTGNTYLRSVVKQEQIAMQNNYLFLSDSKNEPYINQLSPDIPNDQTGYHWFPWNPGYPIPDGAVVGGFDIDEEKIYVCRAYYRYNLLPGKCAPARGKIYITHDGKEITLYKCELLVRTTAILNWVPSEKGNIPKNAVPVGTFARSHLKKDKETLFSGRAKVIHHLFGLESLCLGRVHENSGICYVPFDDYEHWYDKDYEVLVKH